MKASEQNFDTCGSARWPVVAFGLVVAAWIAFLLTLQYVQRLAEQWGPAPDVVDSLGRSAFIARRTLPYYTVVVVLDVAAAVCLLARSRRGWPLAIKVLACVLLVPSCMMHGLAWLLNGFFLG